MYLIEYKLGDFVIRKFILDDNALALFVMENPQYEYVKIIKEVKLDNSKFDNKKSDTKVRVKKK